MPILLSDILKVEPKKAVEAAKGLLKQKVDGQLRRVPGHAANREFYFGNHFQDGEGWIGEKPVNGVDDFIKSTMKKIQQGFVSENVIGEVVDRHLGGILGREVNWDFIDEELYRLRKARKPGEDKVEKSAIAKAADNDTTGWWNEGRPKNKLKEALVTALNEERALLRFFIPRGLRDDKSQIPKQSKLTDALEFLHVDVVYSDKGGVFVDTDTQRPFGVYVPDSDDKEPFVELTWVDKGITFLQILSESPDIAADPLPMDLGGRLWMYELKRKPLITEQVRSNQKSLNLALTMMMRNINLAGSRERYFFNVERPTELVRIADSTQASGYREEKRSTSLAVGPGVSGFMDGVFVKDRDGKIVDRADPNISVIDPVDIATFVGTREQFYSSILGQCQQIHALISKDATASGVSREQARAEFESSLKLSKEVVDDAGRWMLEFALRGAAHLCGETAKYKGLRCDFNTIIETGPISPEERTANREDVAAELLSPETAMSRNGTEDTDAEFARIEEGKNRQPAPVITDLTNKPVNGGEPLPA